MEQAEPYDFGAEGPGLREKAPRSDTPAVIVTLHMGVLEATRALCRLGWRPAVHNFAHGHNCGGGFEHAGGSQEEAIFRATSLFLSLWPHRRTDDGPGNLMRGMWIGDFDEQLARKEAFYPHAPLGGIYSPHVRLSRQMHLPGCPLWPAKKVEEAPLFAVVTAAAQDVPRCLWNFDPELLRQKVRGVLHVAAEHGHGALVLGAFGCGFFRNPPEAVAGAYHELLSGEFASTFKVVVFAIPKGDSSHAFRKFFPLTRPEKLPILIDCDGQQVEKHPPSGDGVAPLDDGRGQCVDTVVHPKGGCCCLQ